MNGLGGKGDSDPDELPASERPGVEQPDTGMVRSAKSESSSLTTGFLVAVFLEYLGTAEVLDRWWPWTFFSCRINVDGSAKDDVHSPIVHLCGLSLRLHQTRKSRSTLVNLIDCSLFCNDMRLQVTVLQSLEQAAIIWTFSFTA